MLQLLGAILGGALLALFLLFVGYDDAQQHDEENEDDGR